MMPAPPAVMVDVAAPTVTSTLPVASRVKTVRTDAVSRRWSRRICSMSVGSSRHRARSRSLICRRSGSSSSTVELLVPRGRVVARIRRRQIRRLTAVGASCGRRAPRRRRPTSRRLRCARPEGGSRRGRRTAPSATTSADAVVVQGRSQAETGERGCCGRRHRRRGRLRAGRALVAGRTRPTSVRRRRAVAAQADAVSLSASLKAVQVELAHSAMRRAARRGGRFAGAQPQLAAARRRAGGDRSPASGNA